MADSDQLRRAAFEQAIDAMPLIAILRGVRPEEAVAVAGALVQAGFRIIEVPLNSPEPFESIRRIRAAYGDPVLLGAGTVTTIAEMAAVQAAGGSLIVMPHTDISVIAAARAAGMIVTPGVLTPTEAMAALHAGADALKLFPAEVCPPLMVKALRAVLPHAVRLIPVGGITPQTMRPYWEAGARGFGIGSALYRPGMSASAVAASAEDFVKAARLIMAG